VRSLEIWWTFCRDGFSPHPATILSSPQCFPRNGSDATSQSFRRFPKATTYTEHSIFKNPLGRSSRVLGGAHQRRRELRRRPTRFASSASSVSRTLIDKEFLDTKTTLGRVYLIKTEFPQTLYPVEIWKRSNPHLQTISQLRWPNNLLVGCPSDVC